MLERSDTIKKIAKKILKEPEFEDINNFGVRIAYLISDKEKVTNRRRIFADCRKVNEQYAWCCKYDFMITVYGPNVLDFDEQQMEILVRHELMHIGIDPEGTEANFYVVPHDVEEFDAIIEKFGLHWASKED